MAYNETLIQKVQEFMSEQDKLELYYDYRDIMEGDQVREFINYCEEDIYNFEFSGGVTDDICEALLFNYFDNQSHSWLGSYISESFHSAFKEPFEEKYGEEEWYDSEGADELLWNEMYNQDKFDANMGHFNTDYHFYILIDPEKSYVDGSDNVSDFGPYLKSLMRSQGRTKNSNSMKDLLGDAYYYCGICVMVNCSLFDFVRLVVADKLTVKKGSNVFLFDAINGCGGVDATLTRDRSFKIKDKKEIGYGCDDARKGPFGYTPDEVYGLVHSYYDKNVVLNY